MDIILFDQEKVWHQLNPLTLNRPVSHLRIGTFCLYQKWEILAKASVSFLTIPYLSKKFPAQFREGTVYVTSQVLPTQNLIESIRDLKKGEALINKEDVVAIKPEQALNWPVSNLSGFNKIEIDADLKEIKYPEDLFLFNGQEIKSDFEILTNGRDSKTITDPFTRVYNPEDVFVEEGASIKASIINAEDGPVYIGENATIQEGSVIVGPVSIGTNAKVGYNATIRQNTTIGPDCRVAGEVSNCIFMAYSNKSHDGYLGNSIVGEWCNFGANSNNSNLKNNYKNVHLYNYFTSALRDTCRVNCGSIVGDFNKFGISSMLNTGTVIGTCSHLYGAGFHSKFIPSFTWGQPSQYLDYDFNKAIEVINATMAYKELELDEDSISILKHICQTKKSQLI